MKLSGRGRRALPGMDTRHQSKQLEMAGQSRSSTRPPLLRTGSKSTGRPRAAEDREPSLGSLENHPSKVGFFYGRDESGIQVNWADGRSDDREEDGDDREPDVDAEWAHRNTSIRVGSGTTTIRQRLRAAQCKSRSLFTDQWRHTLRGPSTKQTRAPLHVLVDA